ncbi:transcriptional regulator, partial [Escherichia coli]|nr:transcriptional regulator [Escherichia coli]
MSQIENAVTSSPKRIY